MIAGADFYAVMCATIPLYTAMLLAYLSVKHWAVFTPSQCAGVNRFVAVFAVPVLSFHFISTNDPYKMDFKFVAADTLSKVAVLGGLFGYISVVPRSRLDWVVTLFSVSTLPNTLVMGIPLLKAMYGDFTQSLMVQLVVLQCIIWYTLLLFLFEYRAATILIRDNFPGKTAASIATFHVDNDVISLDGHTTLYAESESDPAGQLRVRIRRSTSDTATNISITSRPSNLSGAEIYSINTPARVQNQEGLFGYASSEVYSPRESGFNELELVGTPAWGESPAAGAGKVLRQFSPANISVVLEGDKVVGDEKDMSFRSTTKFVECDERESEEATILPRKMVMFRLILTMVGRKLLRNPNTYSSVLGFLWSLLSYRWGIEMPILVKNSIKIISDAGLGMAMFSLGLFMALQPIIACGAKMAAISMAIRFIVGPVVMSAASLAVGLKGVKLHTAIVQAALPQGIVPFVFAREYGLHPDILGTGVIFGMLVSLPVTLIYYILLGL